MAQKKTYTTPAISDNALIACQTILWASWDKPEPAPSRTPSPMRNTLIEA